MLCYLTDKAQSILTKGHHGAVDSVFDADPVDTFGNKKIRTFFCKSLCVWGLFLFVLPQIFLFKLFRKFFLLNLVETTGLSHVLNLNDTRRFKIKIILQIMTCDESKAFCHASCI